MRLILLLFALVLSNIAPLTASAEEEKNKVIRVGWYDSSFCYFDKFGRRCGIDYEYQQKISAYTGWTYEYVEGSWPELLQKLMDGDIDLLSDVSVTWRLKTVRLKAALNNLFNKQAYEETTYTGIATSTTSYLLRPRELILSAEFSL